MKNLMFSIDAWSFNLIFDVFSCKTTWNGFYSNHNFFVNKTKILETDFQKCLVLQDDSIWFSLES